MRSAIVIIFGGLLLTTAGVTIASDEKVEPIKAELEYVYIPDGKRDPFMSPISKKALKESGVVELGPLQKFDTSSFKLTGILADPDRPSAMLISPTGEFHIVKLKDSIGKNNGVITKIDANGVFVREEYTDFTGSNRTKDILLQVSTSK